MTNNVHKSHNVLDDPNADFSYEKHDFDIHQIHLRKCAECRMFKKFVTDRFEKPPPSKPRSLASLAEEEELKRQRSPEYQHWLKYESMVPEPEPRYKKLTHKAEDVPTLDNYVKVADRREMLGLLEQGRHPMKYLNTLTTLELRKYLLHRLWVVKKESEHTIVPLKSAASGRAKKLKLSAN